ncbi:MarR family winged helix-turn-helix transcriptional regulator [Flagellimonas lutimaris]|uniref:MarR family winged helix-turn-helix transcriptional regulator n=1 Tax=Flagellimonas lutimaris TaxID=475082 RepID=UPI0025976152|nr:MarR family winged helix-turn-helix transcriptional regulator [uncultured Allomuricauda sp.]
MDNDFIKELGYKALDSRLKRVSDRMSRDIRKLYQELDVDVEPNWYLIFMLLQKKEKCSISYIAEHLGYAHPSIVVIVQKMSKKGYLKTEQDPLDKRKQVISLSAKANKLMPKLETLWCSCEKAILDILDNDLSILTYLDNIDLKLEKTSFHYRFKQEYLKSIKQ